MPMPGYQGSFNASSTSGSTAGGFNTTGERGTNPYFDPRSTYGANQSYVNTPAVNGPAGYLEQNPQALYTRFTAPFGGGTDPFSMYVQSQQQKIWDAYQAALANNMNLTRQQFLQGMDPHQFLSQFLNLAPVQQGRNDALFGASPLRTISNG